MKKNESKKQTNRGITLIALVITIIVMLILAGVAISLTIGDNGIFKESEQSAKIYNKEEATEKVNLKLTYTQMKAYTQSQRMPTLQEVANDFCEDEEIQYVTLTSKQTASLDKIDIGEAQSFFTKLKQYPYEFEIDSSLKLASIDGIKIADSNQEQIEKLQKEIEELKTENERLKSDLEKKKEIQILQHGLLNSNGASTYTFSKDYSSVVAIVGAANMSSEGNGYITPRLSVGTSTVIYNGKRIAHEPYSINGALVQMKDVKANDAVILTYNYSTIYAIVAIE